MPPSRAEREELFSQPPQRFVRARNALAARLRRTGRARDAAEVARLRKPSVALWLVNRLAATDPTGIRRLIEAADRLRRAHLRRPRSIPEAVAQHRAALEHLMARADRILTEAGVRSSPALMRRAYATLGSAAADRRRHGELRTASLSEELEPGGFEVLGGMPSRHLALVKPAPAAAPRASAGQRREAMRVKAAAARRQRTIERASVKAARLREELRDLEARIERERRSGPT
jgi:hypothetical protein